MAPTVKAILGSVCLYLPKTKEGNSAQVSNTGVTLVSLLSQLADDHIWEKSMRFMGVSLTLLA